MSELPAPVDTLDGWKAIAAHLGRSVRSAQRWERDLQLPVHRIPTPDGGQLVYARATEIDAWRRQHDSHPELVAPPEPVPASVTPPATVHESAVSTPPRRRGPPRWAVALSAGNVALALWSAFVLLRGPAPGETTYRLEANRFSALRPDGRVLWSHDFGRSVHSPRSLRGTAVRETDLDSDGVPEIVTAISFGRAGDVPQESDAVVAFGRGGDLRWLMRPDLTMKDSTRTFTAPWHVRALTMPADGESGRLWAAYSHHTWHPGVLLEIAAGGASMVRYTQDGWIHAVTRWNASTGRYLVVAGTLNAMARPSVALLGLDDPPARVVGNAADPLSCDGCPTALVRHLVLLPTPDVTRALFRPFAWAYRVQPLRDQLQVWIDAGFGEGTLATLEADARVSAHGFADRYWQAHQSLHEDRRLDHGLDDCPERIAPAVVRHWSPVSGWSEYGVARSAQPDIGSGED